MISDWFSGAALVISGAALGLEFRRWFESQPRLSLSVIGDAVEIPRGDGKPKLALTVTNLGSEPTVLTHMIVFTYKSLWKRFRRKPDLTAVVNSPQIPSELKAKHYWM